MINAVIELGDRRVHEVMVPRVAIAALPADAHARGGDRPRRRGRPLAHPGLRRVDRRDRRHPLRQGPAAVPQGRRRAATAAPDAAAAAGPRARVDDGRRPAPRVPAAQGPHRDRARRVRRHGRAGDDRGPARGDRRRDPGRVRRRGADRRAAVRPRGAGRRPGRRRRARSSCSTSTSSSRTRRSTTRSAACLPPHRRRAVAGRHGRGRRACADGRDDRRPAGRQGARHPQIDQPVATDDGEPPDGQRSDRTAGARTPRRRGAARSASPARSGADDGEDDLLEALARSRSITPAASSSASARSRWQTGLVAGVVAGAGALEDRHDLGDVRRASSRPFAYSATSRSRSAGVGVLEGVDHRQRLLLARRRRVGSLPVARSAPQIPSRSSLSWKAMPEVPAEARGSGAMTSRRRSRAARRPRSRPAMSAAVLRPIMSKYSSTDIAVVVLGRPDVDVLALAQRDAGLVVQAHEPEDLRDPGSRGRSGDGARSG